MFTGVFHVLDRSWIYLVSQLKYRTRSWLGAFRIPFQDKFFCAKAKFFLAELDRTRQCPGEYLHPYVGRFQEGHGLLRSGRWRGPSQHLSSRNVETVPYLLRKICLFLFSRMMEEARRTNKSVRRTSKPSSINSPNFIVGTPATKRPIVATL